MRSSILTPRILRCLLRNEPIVHKDCLYKQAIHNRTYTTRARASWRPRTAYVTQRRTLFGWISPVPREAVLATGEIPALNYLIDACSRLDNQVRPPPSEDLAKAWTTFVRERSKRKASLNDGEALAVARVLELIKTTETDRITTLLPDEALWHVLSCFKVETKVDENRDAAAAHRHLSTLLFNEFRARTIGAQLSDVLSKHKLEFWQRHVATLVSCGRPEEARDLISTSDLLLQDPERLWKYFLARLADHGGEMEEAEALSAIVQDHVGSLTDALRKSLSLFYASRGDMGLAKEFAAFQPQKDGSFDVAHIDGLLKACRRHDDVTWGKDIIKTITSNTQAMKTQKPLWNVMFTWALSTGKSVDEVSRMMEVMIRTNAQLRPATQDMNALIQIANERKDPYMAERLVALGDKFGCRPDETTYLLQMDYRLSIGDVEGARTAFDHVKSFQDSDGTADAGARVNRLVQAMCAKSTYPFETIMDTVDFLSERSATFAADTVAALAVLHLGRDEFNDTADLLSTNTKDFSLADRALVRSAILELMLDPSTPTIRLWDTYMIFQHVFRESSRSSRIPIMQAFFAQDRPDMALHVFNHMRRHASPDIQPDTETYINALIGCGQTSDSEALHTINNVLKLDIGVEETTRLHNARMIAFFQCGDAEKAQAVWEDIVRSEEGPSRNSLICIFRVCEQSDFGEVRARSVWKLIRNMDVPLDSEVVAAYVGALVRNGCQEEAVKVVESGLVEVDEMVLGKLFNGAVNSARQAESEAWIRERYLVIWEGLVGRGLEMRWDGTKEVRLDVRMEP